MRARVALVVLLAAVTPAVWAVERIALVIGNADYAHGALELSNPANDARAVEQALAGLGFAVVRQIDVDRATLEQSLERFATDAAGARIALVFYAGHGIQVAGENYLLGTDVAQVELGHVVRHSLPLVRIREALDRAAPELGIVILDACRDNPFGHARLADGSTLAPGLARVRGAVGTLIAYATDPGNYALDGLGDHSPFTAGLLEHLATPDLEVRLMFGRVRQSVVIATSGQQVPWVEEAVLGMHQLNPQDAAPAVPPAIDADIGAWREAVALGTVEAIDDYLSHYPQGLFAPIAPRLREQLARPAAMAAGAFAVAGLTPSERSQVQRSLRILGFYEGPVDGAASPRLEEAVAAYVQAFRVAAVSPGQLAAQAAQSVVLVGAAIGRQIEVDLVRLRSVDRAIEQVAVPAYERLERKLAGRADAGRILDRAREQILAMRADRERLSRDLDRTRTLYASLLAEGEAPLRGWLAGRAVNDAEQPVLHHMGGSDLEPYARLFIDHTRSFSQPERQGSYAWLVDFLR